MALFFRTLKAMQSDSLESDSKFSDSENSSQHYDSTRYEHGCGVASASLQLWFLQDGTVSHVATAFANTAADSAAGGITYRVLCVILLKYLCRKLDIFSQILRPKFRCQTWNL